MKDHTGDTRGFHNMHEAWHASATKRVNPEEVGQLLLGMYDMEGGGTSGEFTITWEMLSGEACARIQAYEDSWSALMRFSDVLAKLAELDSTNPTVAQVTAILIECGVKDITARDMPKR